MVSYTKRGPGFLTNDCACQSKGYTKSSRKNTYPSRQNFNGKKEVNPCKSITTKKYKHTQVIPVNDNCHACRCNPCTCNPCKCGAYGLHECAKPCAKPCVKPCAKLNVEQCQTDYGVCVEKNLLNLAYNNCLTDSVSGTYEIVITNKSCNKLTNLSIVDTFFGFRVPSEEQSGSELNPEFTNVQVLSCDESITPLSFDDIIKNNGQLLNTNKSYIPACSICVITVRITGTGLLLSNEANKSISITSLCVQNTSVVKGTLEVVDPCTCCITEHPIFPIHVKSGEKQAANEIFLAAL